MTKVQINSEKIATFGVIFHVIDLFRSLELDKLIDSELKSRSKSWNTYSYSNIIETLFCNYLCGGDCLEDINSIVPCYQCVMM